MLRLANVPALTCGRNATGGVTHQTGSRAAGPEGEPAARARRMEVRPSGSAAC
jgi:hypothetical protein